MARVSSGSVLKNLDTMRSENWGLTQQAIAANKVIVCGPECTIKLIEEALAAATLGGIIHLMPHTYTENVNIPTGVKIIGEPGAIIMGNVTLVSRNQLEGVDVSGWIRTSTSTCTARILIVCGAYGTGNAIGLEMVIDQISVLETLGINYDVVTDTANVATIQAALRTFTGNSELVVGTYSTTSGLITTAFTGNVALALDDSNYTGAVVCARGGDTDNGIVALIGAGKTKKVLCVLYRFATGATGLGTGAALYSSVGVDMRNDANDFQLECFTDPTGSAETSAGYYNVGMAAAKESGAANTIKRYLYCKTSDAANTKHVIIWQHVANGHLFFARGATVGYDLSLTFIAMGIYLHDVISGAPITGYTPAPLFWNIDDVNQAFDATCITTLAALLRANNGVMPCGWGSSSMLTNGSYDKGFSNPYTINSDALPDEVDVTTAFRNAQDVLPVILHDHHGYPSTSHPSFTIYPQVPSGASDTTVESMALAHMRECAGPNYAGMEVKPHYNGFAFTAGNFLTSGGLKVLHRLGARIFRNAKINNVDPINGDTVFPPYTFSDATASHVVRNIPNGSDGQYDINGKYLASAMTTNGFVGVSNAPIQKYGISQYGTAFRRKAQIHFFHGPQLGLDQSLAGRSGNTISSGFIRFHADSPMEAGATITIGATTYTFVATGAGADQIAVDVDNTAAKQLAALKTLILADADLTGPVLTIITAGTGATRPALLLECTNDTSVTPIIVTCNITAARKIACLNIKPLRSVATDIIDNVAIKPSTLSGGAMRIANAEDWMSI